MPELMPKLASTQKRHRIVRHTFDRLCRQYPQWRVDALIDKTHEITGYANRTIEGILRGEFECR